MENKSKIHEFDPLIYPTRIWVGVDVPELDIIGKFYGLNDKDERFDIEVGSLDYNSFKIASCHPVSDKETGWMGIMCNILRPKNMTVGVIAHEAEHIVCWICEKFGIQSATFEDSEPRAYLTQWVADCIDKVKRGKV